MALGIWGKIVLAASFVAIGPVVAQANDGPQMQIGGRTSQPIGHYEFCRANPRECRSTGARPAPQQLTSAVWKTINNVNRQVNAAYKPMTDMEMWGQEEVWSYPVHAADCEDYVLEKRRRLMEAGIAPGNLLITVLRQTNGDGHAVLTIRTSRGDYILDNLDGRVQLWSNTNYTYLKRQSETHAGVWLSINGGRDQSVATVR